MAKKIKITIKCGCDKPQKLQNGDGCKLTNGGDKKLKQG